MREFKVLIVGAVLALGVAPASHAQMFVDMSKITCDQMLHGSANSIETAIWISGYYNGLHKNTKLDLGQFKHNAELVLSACESNPKKTVMQTINGLLSKKK